MTEDAIVAALASARFHVVEEGELHRAIARVLTAHGIEAEHEVKIGARDRIDFLVGDVGVEVKMKGKVGAIARQLARYAESPRIARLLLLTTRMSYVALDGQVLHGKPVRVVRLAGGLV